MKAIVEFLVPAIISATLFACGGGDGKSQQIQIPDPPAAPVVTVSAGIKQLIFSWEAVATATHYRLLENPDGHSGFTQVGGNIPSAETAIARDIAVHLHDWVNALYLVQACNAGGCTDSTRVGNADAMLETIGYFKASNTDPGDAFGGTLAMSADGKTIAVGAPHEASDATGINGDQSDNSLPFAGVVYVFRLDNGHWSQEAYVKPSDIRERGFFGNYAIALSEDGNTLAISEIPEAGPEAVYVFRYSQSQWLQQAFIQASNSEYRDRFGQSIALSADGNTLAVGASGEDSIATGLNGDEDDNSAAGSGAAYVFRFVESQWVQQAYIKASNSDESDNFGIQVVLSANGNTLIVGATGESSSATGVNGDQLNELAIGSGAVYVFRFDQTLWSQQAYVKASNTDPGDRFGDYLALSGDGNTLAVAASSEESAATGINGNQTDNTLWSAGAVYLYSFEDTDWKQRAYVKASNMGWSDFFNTVALSMDGNTLAVGAVGEASSATGINGDQNDDSLSTVGAVYLFQYEDTGWSQRAYIKASNTEDFDRFGRSLALSADGETLAIGARGENSAATGINGDQTDNSAENSGAVYVY